MIEFTCPYCGARSITEQPQQVQCLGCGAMLNVGSGQLPNECFHPDEPAAQQPPGDNSMQQSPGNNSTQQPACTPQQRELAAKKRSAWHFLNVMLLLIQAGLVAGGALLSERGYDLGTALIISWFASVPLFAILSPAMRPKDGYPDRKPLIQSKIAHFFIQLLLGALTLFPGALIFMILDEMF